MVARKALSKLNLTTGWYVKGLSSVDGTENLCGGTCRYGKKFLTDALLRWRVSSIKGCRMGARKALSKLN